MNPDQLVDRAIDSAGSDDFGPDGADMHSALGVLVQSLNEEAGLTLESGASVAAMLESTLVRRLQIEQCYATNPEISDEGIESVLFGLGLPRTGSTALSFLLAKDPHIRYLRGWEASQPTPPPELATEDHDPRFLAAVEAASGFGSLPPEIKAMVPTAADGPAECLGLMSLSFTSQAFDVLAQTPSYGNWLVHGCDYGPCYRYHRRALQLLQWHRPPSRWRLKTPAHVFGIDALDETYPESRFVVTHRDVTTVIPSLASFETAVVKMFTGQADPLYLGAHCVDVWDAGLRRFIAFRDRVGEERFYDIGFAAMQSDPLGVVRGLYEWLGEELTPEALTAMQRWWDASQRDRDAGVGHRYEPEDFGLDAGELAERFAYYGERFPMAQES
jgi:hypothetical protein